MVEAENEAEQKAAKKLRASPVGLVLRAYNAWGRGFTAERDRRVFEHAKGQIAPRRLQALRGHVTRQLLKELGSKVNAEKQLSANGRLVRAMRHALKGKHLSPKGREKLLRRLEQLTKCHQG